MGGKKGAPRRPGCFEYRGSSADEGVDVLIDGGDGADIEFVLKDFEDIGGEECWQCGAGVDVLHAEGEEREQYYDGFLLVPCYVVNYGEFVDILEAEGIAQGECYADK